MNRWIIRIFGIVMLLLLFFVMFQMLNTLKRMAERRDHGALHGVRWPQPLQDRSST